MNQKQNNIIKRKTNEFCEEVKCFNLTEENKRVYNALFTEELNHINLR